MESADGKWSGWKVVRMERGSDVKWYGWKVARMGRVVGWEMSFFSRMGNVPMGNSGDPPYLQERSGCFYVAGAGGDKKRLQMVAGGHRHH